MDINLQTHDDGQCDHGEPADGQCDRGEPAHWLVIHLQPVVPLMKMLSLELCIRGFNQGAV